MNNKHTPGPWEWNDLDQLVATSVFDGMASAYRAMIPVTTNAQEGTVQ